jgi:hypothetical protein
MDATESPQPVRPKRINVAVNEDELRALDLVIAREGVSLTEAVRRLLAYGEFVYQAIRVDGVDVQFHFPTGEVKSVVLF